MSKQNVNLWKPMSKESGIYIVSFLVLLAGLILGYSLGINGNKDAYKRYGFIEGRMHGAQFIYRKDQQFRNKIIKQYKMKQQPEEIATPLPTPVYLKEGDIPELGD